MSALAHEMVVPVTAAVAPQTDEAAAGLRILGFDLDDEHARYASWALLEAWRGGVTAGAAKAARAARVVTERAQREAAADVLHALMCDQCGGNDLGCAQIKARFLILGNAAINAARTVTE